MEPLKILSPIHKASRQIEIYLEDRIRGLGFTTKQGHLLTYLLSYGPCPISELHQVFGFKRSTLTSVLDRLADHDLISRTVHPSDRRSWMIRCTPKGKTAAHTLRAVLVSFESAIMGRLKAGEIKAYYRIMQVIEETTGIRLKTPRKEA